MRLATDSYAHLTSVSLLRTYLLGHRPCGMWHIIRWHYRHLWIVEDNSHTHTQPFNGLWSGTTWAGRYQKELTHSPTHTHPDHRTQFINFLHLLRSTASSVLILHAWQSFSTTSLQVLFGLPLGLGPSTSYSMHFFTQSSSSFRSTSPYQRSLFSFNTKENYPRDVELHQLQISTRKPTPFSVRSTGEHPQNLFSNL